MSLSCHEPPSLRIRQRRRGLVGAALVGAALPLLFGAAVSPAAAAVRYSLSAGAEATWASNPLLLRGGNLPAVMFEGTLSPGVKVTGDTGSSFELAGELRPRAYTRRYGEFLLGEVLATGVLRKDERLTATATAGYNRDLSADILAEGVDASVDPRSIRNAWQARAAATWTPNARDTVTPTISFDLSTFEGTQTLDETRTIAADIAYNRRTSARTAIGVRTAAYFSRSGSIGSFTTAALFATIDQRLSEVLRFNAEAGIEHSRDDDSGETNNQFSGRVQLCATGERTNGCVNAAVASQVGAVGGLQRRYTFGATANHVIGPRHSLEFAADYQRAEQNIGTPVPTISAARLRAALNWQLDRALILTGQAEYRRRDIGIGSAIDGIFAGLQLRWQHQ